MKTSEKISSIAIIAGIFLVIIIAVVTSPRDKTTDTTASISTDMTQALDTSQISEESVLPVVSIQMRGKVGDDYTDATMTITDDSGVTPSSELYDGNISIKLRGNSTRNRVKQPYKIKLESKTDLFGMGEDKHWVLLANDIDHTLIRNKITLDFANDIGMKFAPESVLVTVKLNGDYLGVYQLCEQIRVDENRVNIYDWEDVFGVDYAIPASEIETETEQTGGFLLEADFYAFTDNSLSRVITNFKQPFYFNTPQYVSEDTELYQYTKNYLQSFEYALHSPNFVYHSTDVHYAGSGRYYDSEKEMWYSSLMLTNYNDTTYEGYHYSQLFDMDSLVQNFLVCEMTMNWDCMKNSMFIYKDITGLAFMGPVWDFDWAYGNINMYNIFTNIPEGWQTTNNYFTNEQYYQSVQWNRYLIRDPYFVLQVYNKYHEVRDSAIQKLVDSIDAYENYLSYDGEANDEKWSFSYSGRFYSGATSEEFHDAMESLRSFVQTRVAWLDEQFTDFDTLYQSLGACSISEDLQIIDVEKSDTYVITAATSLEEAACIELQINGINIVTAPVQDGEAVVEANADWFASEVNMIQIRAIDKEGNYLFASDVPDTPTLMNYYLY